MATKLLDAKTYAEGGLAALRSADELTLGVFLTLCREYGRKPADFAHAHPQQWRPVMDATAARDFLVAGRA